MLDVCKSHWFILTIFLLAFLSIYTGMNMDLCVPSLCTPLNVFMHASSIFLQCEVHTLKRESELVQWTEIKHLFYLFCINSSVYVKGVTGLTQPLYVPYQVLRFLSSINKGVKKKQSFAQNVDSKQTHKISYTRDKSLDWKLDGRVCCLTFTLVCPLYNIINTFFAHIKAGDAHSHVWTELFPVCFSLSPSLSLSHTHTFSLHRYV